jgi:hypothetical protein
MILGAVSMAAINHHDSPLTLLFQSCFCGLHISGAVVGSLGSPTKDHKAVFVACCAGDCGKALLGDPHEMVGMRGGEYRVNGNRHGAVSTVLEPYRERYTRGEFAVKLGFGGARANCCER